MNDSLLILGASARAAAFSALRGGFRPVCGDLFADADLAAQCPVSKPNDYPGGLADLALAAPSGPWLYVGALENHPELVRTVADARPLWGNFPSVLRRVRDPFQWTFALRSARLPACRVLPSGEGLPRDGSWLRKKIRSGGGSGIHAWDRTCRQPIRDPDWFFQQRVVGTSLSGSFLASRNGATLLGVTEQLVGASWLHAKPFHYCGSLGSIELASSQRGMWERMGNCLREEFQLTGLFGVDAMESSDGLYPVEVNPRYSASLEVLERAGDFSAIRLHADACRDRSLPDGAPRASDRCFGKAILFAPREVRIPASFTSTLMAENEDPLRPVAADLPAGGVSIRAGRPICTIFAEASTSSETIVRLQEQTQRLMRLLKDS
ncbi:MAG: ATP-grasp domain-containing protein [Planctomycetales bacterium]